MADTSLRPDSVHWPEDHKALPAPQGASWVLFAGIMVCLVGLLNIIWGIAAISDSRFFVQDATFVLSGLNTFGWILLLLGVGQICVAYAIWKGSELGRWLGIGLAGLNAIGALMSISAHPYWALCVFGLDILIIYGLARYGGDPRMAQ